MSRLRDTVEVIRDRWGVPHIYARNTDDLFFAQGYVQAQDRLWQMEMYRRTFAGTLSEIMGPSYCRARSPRAAAEVPRSVRRPRVAQLSPRGPADLRRVRGGDG